MYSFRLDAFAASDNASFSLARKPHAVAVALSGGPDSMALCYALAQWAETESVALHALTVDHGLRAESLEEARSVGQWVSGWTGVNHEILSAHDYLRDADSRLMEAARHARYELLNDYCRRHGIEYLFLAHHQDDQAETFLFRLAKGSGFDGLAAMTPVSLNEKGVTIVRPLLGVPKADLIRFCADNGIPFVSDPTNENPAYARNRLRRAHDVLAAEGLTAARLAVTAKRIGRARAALEHYADQAFRDALKEDGAHRIVFTFTILDFAPEDIRLRVILRGMERLVPDKGGYGPRRDRLEALMDDLFARDAAFRKRTLGGVIVSRDTKKDLIVLEAEEIA